jgi:hypothetical protein
MMPVCPEPIIGVDGKHEPCGKPAIFKITHRNTGIVIHRCEQHATRFYSLLYDVVEMRARRPKSRRHRGRQR